jgi:Uma2 family endonuclease
MSMVVAPIARPSRGDAVIPDVPIHRLTVAQYLAMTEAGILTDEDRVELLEGWLVAKMSKNPPHASVTRRLRRILDRVLSAGWLVLTQDPILTADSAPEPDVCIARGDEASFEQRHPTSSEVALVVEVADSSLRQDRDVKMRIYAQAGIPIYWIVNLIERQVEVYTDPTGPAAEPEYRQRRDIGIEDTISVVLDGADVGRLAVQELLP